MVEKTERVAYLDILRVLSALAVITIHVVAYEFYCLFGQSTWWWTVFLDGLAHWAVPLFVMISGSLFLDPKRKVNNKKLFRKKIPHLLFLYCFWWVVYFFLLVAIGIKPFTLASLLKPSVHLWFLPMLIGLYLIVPFLRLFMNNKRLVRYYLLLWFAFSTFELLPIVPRFTNAFLMSFVMKYSGYFVLGHYLSSSQFTRKQNRLVYLLGLLSSFVIVVGTILKSQYDGQQSIEFMELLTPQYMFLSSAIFLYVKNHSRHCKPQTLRVVGFLQKYTLGIYLVHSFWISFLATDTVRHCCSVYITLPVIIIAIAIVSFLTVVVLQKIPLLKKTVQ